MEIIKNMREFYEKVLKDHRQPVRITSVEDLIERAGSAVRVSEPLLVTEPQTVVPEGNPHGLYVMELDDAAQRYIKDMEWVQRDIWKLPDAYPPAEPASCEVFAKDIPDRRYTAGERRIIDENLRRIQKFMQGPFWLGEDIVVGGFWDKRNNSEGVFKRFFPGSLEGMRVLEIGSMSGYDSFHMNLRNPSYYLSIEPSGFHYQARFLNSIYRTSIDFRQWFWQDIPEEMNGTFDLILNYGCLYHEYDPVSMVRKTAELLRPGGKTIVATVSIRNKEHSEFIKYMPDIYHGDMTYWFVFGQEALIRLYRSFGCEGRVLHDAGCCPQHGDTGLTVEGYPSESMIYYEFVKVENRSRPLITIPKYQSQGRKRPQFPAGAISPDVEKYIGMLEASDIEKSRHIDSTAGLIKERDARIEDLQSTLGRIYASRGWKTLLGYYRLRDRLKGRYP